MATAVSVLLLVVVLAVVAFGRVPDAAVTVPAALLVLVTGLVSVDDALDTLNSLVPTLVFLASVLVIGEVARAAGVFRVLGDVLVARGDGSPARVVVLVSLGAMVVTAFMSLDATAVLFTPVVLHVVAELHPRAAREQPLLATAHLANASSGWLPVSNLTNLLVFPATGLTFAGYAARMLLPTVAASAVVLAVARGRSPGQPDGTPARQAGEEGHRPLDALDPFARFVLGVIGAMVVGFFVVSQLGGQAAWVAAVTAGVVGGSAVARGRDRARRLAAAASPRFLLFVAALAIVVRAAVDHGLGDAAGGLLPGGASFPALLATVVVAAVLANLVNNVPATLVLLGAIGSGPGAAPLLLALLIGVNVGPNVTYTGSLATLLWRRAVRAAGAEPRHRAFYANAWLATPLALLVATAGLWCALRLLGA